ncbi:MAG: ATP-binding protein, partial [Minisyncoccia bacterium]
MKLRDFSKQIKTVTGKTFKQIRAEALQGRVRRALLVQPDITPMDLMKKLGYPCHNTRTFLRLLSRVFKTTSTVRQASSSLGHQESYFKIPRIISSLTGGAMHHIKNVFTHFAGPINPTELSVTLKALNRLSELNKLSDQDKEKLLSVFKEAADIAQSLEKRIDEFHGEIKLLGKTPEEEFDISRLSHLEEQLSLIMDQIKLFGLTKRRLEGTIEIISKIAGDKDIEKVKKQLMRKIHQALKNSEQVERMIKLVFGAKARISTDVVNLRQYLEKIKEQFLDYAESEEVPVDFNLKIDKNVAHKSIFSYLDPLDSIFMNILTNSLKYRNEQEKLQITLKAAMDWKRGMAIFEVSDNGIGISPEKIGLVFKEGERLGREEITKRGSGYGLASVKELIDRVAGYIEAYSKGENQGTRFSVGLPVNTKLQGPKLSKPLFFVFSGKLGSFAKAVTHALVSREDIFVRYIHWEFMRDTWVDNLVDDFNKKGKDVETFVEDIVKEKIDQGTLNEILSHLNFFLEKKIDYSEEPLKLNGEDTAVIL